MTDLSWTFYIIGVIGPLKDLFGIVSLFLGIAIMFASAVSFDGLGDLFKSKDFKRAASVWLVLVTLALLIPSESTMYKITAVEVGNVVVHTPEAQEIKNLLMENVRTALDDLREQASE